MSKKQYIMHRNIWCKSYRHTYLPAHALAHACMGWELYTAWTHACSSNRITRWHCQGKALIIIVVYFARLEKRCDSIKPSHLLISFQKWYVQAHIFLAKNSVQKMVYILFLGRMACVGIGFALMKYLTLTWNIGGPNYYTAHREVQHSMTEGWN